MMKAKRKFLGANAAFQKAEGRVNGDKATSKGVLPNAA